MTVAMKKPLFASGVIAATLAVNSAIAFTVGVDLVPVSTTFDDFNDGIDTATNFSNASTGGETGGVASVVVGPGAPDPQVQFLSPAAINPFSVDDFPFFRLMARGPGAGGQVFPLPPSGATVVGYGNGPNFAESRLTFVTPGPNGAGLRIDPTNSGGAGPESYEFDYVHLDQYPTVSLGEFDRDGGQDGWIIAGNGHVVNAAATAATSALAGTTAGVDPILQRSALNVDTSAYQTIEIRLAVDPLSNSRFEFFWGTNTFPGPAGGQSVAITAELVRDGEFHTYRFDMSDEPAWDGTLNLLRLDPLADADAGSGRSFAIDYVRVISGAGVLDSDQDGVPDNVETDTDLFLGPRDVGSDPFDPDSDDDSFDDGEELLAGTNPNDDTDFPTGSFDGYALSPAVYVIGEAITPNLPVVSGSTLVSTSITPALPAGLEIDDENGEIRGTPTAVSPATVYTITGEFASGAIDTFDLTLEVSNPALIGYSASPATYTRHLQIVPNTPILLGEAPVAFSIAPALPDGLEFDTGTGEISGTPNGFGGPDEFLVTAFYDTEPDSTFDLTITVEAAPLLAVDPADLIGDFVPLGEFNNDGDLEGWLVGGRGDPHSASVSGGLATFATNPIQFPEPGGGDDPQFTRTGLGLDVAGNPSVILEIRVRQNEGAPQPIEFFWGDGSGGPSPSNSFVIPAAQVPDDNDFHVFQIDMTGVFVDPVNVIRLDPGNLAGRSFDFDYVRLGSVALPEPPRITAITQNFLGEFEITWTSQEGKTYDLEASADLGGWSALNTEPIAASPGSETTTFPDVTSPGLVRRYYRVIELAP